MSVRIPEMRFIHVAEVMPMCTSMSLSTELSTLLSTSDETLVTGWSAPDEPNTDTVRLERSLPVADDRNDCGEPVCARLVDAGDVLSGPWRHHTGR